MARVCEEEDGDAWALQGANWRWAIAELELLNQLVPANLIHHC